MAVTASQITVTTSPTILFSSTADNSNCLSIRNTGSVTVLLGPSGNIVFPLQANEFLGITVSVDDRLMAQTSSGTGQITILGMN